MLFLTSEILNIQYNFRQFLDSKLQLATSNFSLTAFRTYTDKTIYASPNYYGDLQVIDYMQSQAIFDQFQEPSKVNIQGLPWNESLYLLTFVVPLFNKKQYLDNFFNSVLTFTNSPQLNPTNTEYEIVVVDSHSTDGSYEYLLLLASILNSPKLFNSIQAVNPDTNSTDDPQPNRQSDSNFPYSYIQRTKYGEELTKQDFNESFSLYKNISRLCKGNPNTRVRIIRLNKPFLGNIVRQIGAEYSMGRYIWQVDPDDLIDTNNIPKIVEKLFNESQANPPIDMLKFGFCQYTYRNNNLPRRPHCFNKYKLRFSTHTQCVAFLVERAQSWQLWQCMIRRDTFLKGVEAVKLHAPGQEKILVANDLFLFSASIAFTNSIVTMPINGYNYFYMRPGSESLKIWKQNVNTRISFEVIIPFIHYLFDNMSMKFHKKFSTFY